MKKFFNKFLAVALLSAAVAFVGCKDYDADINDLQGQIDGLQSQIDEINSLIESGSVITNVESISNGIKVTLSNGDSYEITNGTDGTNGTNGTNGSDGADGSVVTIGENGNWYIDGVDTGLAAEGKDGQDGQDGSNGTNGTNGSNGTNGNDGADGANGDYYVPNAETGYFDLYTWNAETNSYDVTSTGISFLASGAITATVNADGTVTLFGLEGYEDGVVLGKVVITSLLASEVAGDGFVFESGNSMPWVDNYYVLTSDGKTALSSTHAFSYVVNPTTATAPESWNLNAFAVDTRAASSFIKSNNSNSIYSLADGKVTVAGKFDVANTGVELEDAQELRFTLEANLEDGGVVTSNTAMAANTALTYVYIGNRALDEDYKTSTSNTLDLSLYLPTSLPLIGNVDNIKSIAYDDAEGVSLENLVYGEGYYYDNTGWPTTLLFAWLGYFNIEDYSFAFSLPTSYIGADGVTNQQDYVEIVDGKLIVKNEEWGTSAIGRTPVVEVKLMSDPLFGDPTALATGYLKFEISREVEEPEPLEPLAPLNAISDTTTLAYVDLYAPNGDGTNVEYSTDWETINKAIYKELGLTYEEFVNLYGDPTITYSHADVLYATYNADSGVTTPTSMYEIQVNGKAEWGTYYTVTLTFSTGDENTNRNVVITNKFVVTAPDEVLPEFSDLYVNADFIQETKGRDVDGSYEMSILTSEAFDAYLASYEADETTLQSWYNNTLNFIVNKKNPSFQTNIELSGYDATTITGIQEQVLSYNEAMTLATEDVAMVFQIKYENGMTQPSQKDWTIRFVNPVTVTLDAMSLASLDVATDLYVDDYLTVMYKDQVAFANGAWDTAVKNKYSMYYDSAEVKISDLTVNNGVNLLSYTENNTQSIGSDRLYFSWNNGGSVVLSDFTGAAVAVSISAKTAGGDVYAVATASADLTILSTANSK